MHVHGTIPGNVLRAINDYRVDPITYPHGYASLTFKGYCSPAYLEGIL